MSHILCCFRYRVSTSILNVLYHSDCSCSFAHSTVRSLLNCWWSISSHLLIALLAFSILYNCTWVCIDLYNWFFLLSRTLLHSVTLILWHVIQYCYCHNTVLFKIWVMMQTWVVKTRQKSIFFVFFCKKLVLLCQCHRAGKWLRKNLGFFKKPQKSKM